MTDEHDNDLHTLFTQQRREDRENAPAWRPELLQRRATPQRASVRWMPVAFASACVIALVVFLADSPSQPASLSELPPLFDAPPAKLFAQVEPPLLAFESPSDFLLPDHLNSNLP